jgi:hypothetical protein
MMSKSARRVAVLAAALLAGTAPPARAALTHVRSLEGPVPSVFGLRILPLAGTQALISASYHCSGGTSCTGFAASGAAYRTDVTTGAILQSFFNPTPGLFDVFGFGSAEAAGRFFVSAMLDDEDGGAENGGTVYVYDAGSGALVDQVARPAPLPGAYFGYALASDAGQVLIGAYKGGLVYLVDATNAGGRPDLRRSEPGRGLEELRPGAGDG